MSFFKKILKKNIDLNNIPVHIAIIMDGNGRWAKKRGLPRTVGHNAGAKALERIIEASGELGIKYLTVYAFSTENWSRPQEEVNHIMDLFLEYFKKFNKDERNKKVKLKVLGDINTLPKNIQNEIIISEQNTKDNIGLQLNVAINYGGRDEIHNAIKKIVYDLENGNIAKDDIDSIDQELFSKYLYSKDIPDPDLIIRPSGEQRLSNFLLYQCAYSEFWFPDINWPDFNKEILIEAISHYQKRSRRFGGI